MKFLRFILPVVASAAFVSSAFAQGDDGTAQERDLTILRDYLDTKRLVTINEKGGELAMSGDVRAKWNTKVLTVNGATMLGSSAGRANNTFTSEVNLLFDYRADGAWASVKLEFENAMGVDTGAFSGIDTERAYIGYNLWQDGAARLDLEVGRQQSSDIFDSELMFDSVYDGFLVSYRNSFDGVGDFFIHGGGVVRSDVAEDYVWMGEVGLSDMFDTGLYFKYALAAWGKIATDSVSLSAVGYDVSQFLAGYVFDPEMLQVPAKIYGAFLINHDARRLATTTNGKHADEAWYAGVTLGELDKAGDWSIDAQYQWVEAQVVPDGDMAGIGRGPGLSTSGSSPTSITGNSLYDGTQRGQGNFKGYQIAAYYNITDNVTLKGKWQDSVALDRNIGGRNTYHNFEMSVIFGW